MNPTLPLILLLGGAASSSGTGDAVLSRAEQRSLERFSARWSVRFTPVPSPGRPTREPHSLTAVAARNLVDAIESHLTGARQALARLDDGEAASLLDSAAQLIRAHPELPQAAWLLAEQLSVAAEIAERSSEEAARALRARAAGLEGSRVPPLRDAEQTEPVPDTAESALPVELTGLDARDELEWDGIRATLPLYSVVGEHAARVFRRGQLVWAGWVQVAPGRVTALATPPMRPCSALDLHGVTAGAQRPSVPEGVLCPRWAVARGRPSGDLEFAACERARCSGWQSLAPERSVRPRSARRHGDGFPTWATVALAGIGAALTTSLVLWQTDAFETRTTRERWIYGGHGSAR